MSLRFIAIGLAALLSLTACGDAKDGPVLEILRDKVQGIGKPAPEKPTAEQIRSRLTPEVLATLPGSVAVANIPQRNAAAVLFEAGRNGDTVTYFTPDGISVALRSGMLVGTRGIGFDLMNADVEGSLAALAGGPSRGVTRLHRYLDGENATQLRSLVCDYARTGARISETCRTPGMTIANSYVMTSDGRIGASRQWIGPESGYLEIQQVRR